MSRVRQAALCPLVTLLWLAACTDPDLVYIGSDIQSAAGTEPSPPPGLPQSVRTDPDPATAAAAPSAGAVQVATPAMPMETLQQPDQPAPQMTTPKLEREPDAGVEQVADEGLEDEEPGTDDVEAPPAPAAQVTCAPGMADCDGNAVNGCETELDRDANHCGACGIVCDNAAPGVASSECVMGACVNTCSLANLLGDCDGDPTNGCETDLYHDVNNCGGCGIRCSVCVDRRCL